MISGTTAGEAKRRIRLGMVGGGPGAFIGAVHRIAARMDDHYELVAAALSSDAARSDRSAGGRVRRSEEAREQMFAAASDLFRRRRTRSSRARTRRIG